MIKLVICIAAFLSLVTSTPIQQCPVIVRHENSIPDRYLVKFRDGATMDSIFMATNTNTTTLMDNWLADFNIFIGKFDPDQLSTLQLNSDIEYIEQDAIVQLPMPVIEGSGDLEDEVIPEDPIARPIWTVQRKAPWGLDRLSRVNRSWLQDPSLLYFEHQYFYNVYPKRNVEVYVLDSGIYLNHAEYRGRARWGATFIGDPKSTVDEFGHGTMMSGAIAGTRFGVAKHAKLIAVKVMDKTGTGTLTSITNGLAWILSDVKRRGKGAEKIVNMSISWDNSPSILGAISRLVPSNIHLVACAGNDNKDAKNVSPANSPHVITVGASNIADSRWSGSNWGTRLDLFAPGEYIYTASKSSPTNYEAGSGTSLAAAYVSGILAYTMTLDDDIRPKTLKQKLIKLCRKDSLRNIGRGSPNLLAGNGIYGMDGPLYSDSEAQFIMDRAQIAYTMNQFGADDSDE